MKAEERHKRQTNELADFIGQWILRIKPYTNHILWGLLLIVLAVAAVVVWNRWQATKVQNAWDAFYDGAVLGTPDSTRLEYAFGLREPTDSEAEGSEAGPVYEDSAAAPWATLAAAEGYRARGCDELFRNKENAERELLRAAEYYTKVRAETEQGSMLHTQATFGLAQTYEALGRIAGSEGDPGAIALYDEVVDTALRSYQPGSMADAIEACDEVVTLALGKADSKADLLVAEAACRDLLKGWASGPYANRAMQRLEDLRRPETERFYEDFAEFDPTTLNLPPAELEIPPTKPDTKKPETEQPKPGSKEPKPGEPKKTEPKPEKSAPEKPEPKQVDPEKPAPTEPKAAKPEAPEGKAAEPKKPEPKTDAPAPEAPGKKQAEPEEPGGETEPALESKPAPDDPSPKPQDES